MADEMPVSRVWRGARTVPAADLDREVSRTTGDSVATIRSLRFSLAEPEQPEPLVIDWEKLEASRVGLFSNRQPRKLRAT